MKPTNLDETLAHIKPLDEVIEEERRKRKKISLEELSKEFIILENVFCFDAIKEPYHQYKYLAVAKNVEEDKNGNFLQLTTYEAIRYFEQKDNDMFLPSFALQCNIVSLLEENKEHLEYGHVLDQYKSNSLSSFHKNNTLVDIDNGNIIHYPTKNDLSRYGLKQEINKGKNRNCPFNKSEFDFISMDLGKALDTPNKRGYITHLTGLLNPTNILHEIRGFSGQTGLVSIAMCGKSTLPKSYSITTHPFKDTTNVFRNIFRGVYIVKVDSNKEEKEIKELIKKQKSKKVKKSITQPAHWLPPKDTHDDLEDHSSPRRYTHRNDNFDPSLGGAA